MPLNGSLEALSLDASIVEVFMRNLINSFVLSQVTFSNELLYALDAVARNGNQTISYRYPDYEDLTNKIMVSPDSPYWISCYQLLYQENYMRGVIEYSVTVRLV